MVEIIDLKLFKKIISNINDTILENKLYLCELDSVIGDGDHGISIAKGFKSAIERIAETDPDNISDLLVNTGNAISVAIGGVTGPIFGKFFLELGKALDKDKKSVNLQDLKVMVSSTTSEEGEVKIWPIAAASAIPFPTYSAKRGSWPEPPPITIPTLFLTGASILATAVVSPSLFTLLLFDSTKPSISSSTILSGSFISFFMDSFHIHNES